MHKSPFQNLLSADFLTQVLPLHMPPPSLSDPDVRTAHDPLPHKHPHRLSQKSRPPSSDENQDVQSVDDVSDDDDNSDDDRVIYGRGHQWKSDGDDNDDDDDDDDDDDVLSMKSSNSSPLWIGHHPIGRRRSLSSFSKSQTPSTSTTASSVLVPSPPRQGDVHQVRWMQAIAQLRRSLVLSTSAPTTATNGTSHGTKQPPPLPRRSKKDGFIPMPPAPRRPPSQRRRSEATTQPRFNPETNTYTRDTRSNPDHLRMISSELNMMRARKLLSPLKPRGFLPRRKDPFVRGSLRRTSHLRYQLADENQDHRDNSG